MSESYGTLWAGKGGQDLQLSLNCVSLRRADQDSDRHQLARGPLEPMPICIAGMHRSGTSMVTRMLNLCGLYLGDEADLINPQPDNPEGFWEHKRFLKINEAILELFGGGWDMVPDLPPGWERDPRLDGLREEARKLCLEFKDYPAWGWKDPRTSLTLSFWRTLLPDLKVIVLLRNPIDVANSLTKRGYATQNYGFALWNAYMNAVEKDEPADTRILSHYGTFFSDAEAELLRLVAFCGIHPSESQLREALDTVATGLRHSDSTALDLFISGASPETIRTYLDACLDAGPSSIKLLYSDATKLASLRRDEEFKKVLADKARAVDNAIAEQQIEKERAVELLRTDIAAREAMVVLQHRRGAAMAQRLNHEIAVAEAREGELAQLRALLAGSVGETEQLRVSPAYRIGARMLTLRSRVAPSGSFQDRLLLITIRALRKIRRDGWLSLPGASVRAIVRRLKAPKKVESVVVEQQPLVVVVEPRAPEVLSPEQSLVRVVGVSEERLDAQTLADRIRVAMANRKFCLSLSHDSYLAATGGVQALIREEMNTLLRSGTSHIHACPTNWGTHILEEEWPNALISVDGKAVGIATGDDFSAALSVVGESAQCVGVQVHHILNWTVALVDKILASVKCDRKFYWLHDYFTVCPNFTLLRNDRNFCFAPPLESNSCMVCKYGKARHERLRATERFVRQWNFNFLAPSAVARDVWTSWYGDLADKVSVCPLYSLVQGDQPNPRMDPRERPIRVAYVAQSALHKGWKQWRKIVHELKGNEKFELFHLGFRSEDFSVEDCPETYVSVQTTPANPDAMIRALADLAIDVVIFCPIWPETFSIVTYEAEAAGCIVLTTRESGNVARHIDEAGSGRVFDTNQDLIDFLWQEEHLRNDLLDFQLRYPMLHKLAFNEEIVKQHYLETSSAVIETQLA